MLAENIASWLGALIATGAFTAYTAMILFRPATNRTSSRMYGVQLPALAGLILAAGGSFTEYARTGSLPIAPLATAVVGFAIIGWYAWFYGNYDRAAGEVIRLGQRVPTLHLETLDGQAVTSDDFIGSETLLVFFRANWCTLCMAQLRELRARADRVEAAGVQVKFVSNQPIARSRELARRLELPTQFQILYDRDLRAAHALSIVDAKGTPSAMVGYPRDTVMATVIGLDRQSRVVYANEPHHYRERPNADSVLRVFDGQHVPTSMPRDAIACELDSDAESTGPSQPEMCQDC
jgi:peroxiredoxin